MRTVLEFETTSSICQMKKMMKTNNLFIFLLFSCMVYVRETCGEDKISVPDTTLQRLFDLVLEDQTRQEYTPTSGRNTIKSKGSYKNVIKVNRVGDCLQTALRWAINVDDLNTFTPMWVSIVLLEAYQYGRAPKLSDEQLISTLEFCNGSKDVSKSYNNSLMGFWPYVSNKERHHSFKQLAYTKLMNLASLLPSNNLDEKLNLNVAMEIFYQISGILTETGNLKYLFSNMFRQLVEFNQFPDADVTFVWLGLGSMLNMLGDELPTVKDTWNLLNSNISSVFDALKKYKYRPFSTDPRENTIDTASYYVLRDFLNDANASGKDVAIATTWLNDADEKSTAEWSKPWHKNINDIDGTVCANVINGITTSILSGLVGPELLNDPELNQIYQNTTSMLAYLINSNFSSRQDLALPYYPSRYQFYYTVARTVSILDIHKRKGQLPVEVMELVFSDLKQAMEGEATRFIISNAKLNDDGSIYFNDFLGNGDLTEDNEPIFRGEDRIFTTAMAANVLMYTWLSFDSESSQSYWKAGTPKNVKDIVDGSVLWLSKHAFEGKPWNAFFSPQDKGTSNFPFRYPANLFIEKPKQYSIEYVTSVQAVVGVQGYIHKSEYDAMINSTHFGKPTPTVFKGFNHPDFSDMIFWSSDSYTYALTLLALSRYREIIVAHIITID